MFVYSLSFLLLKPLHKISSQSGYFLIEFENLRTESKLAMLVLKRKVRMSTDSLLR